MGLISGILGNTPIATSAMKGAQTGEYGQSGIVGTILKMYLGGAAGGALGGAAGGGASGMTGAANGISGVTSSLGGGGGAAGGSSAAGKGGASSAGGGMGDTLMQGIQSGDMDWSKLAGQGVDRMLQGGGSQQTAPDMMQPMYQQQQEQSNGLDSLLSQASKYAPQQGNGLSQIQGVPDYFLKMMENWK